MAFIDVQKFFGQEKDAKQKHDELITEAENQPLASNGGYLTFVKYALFGLLGVLNFRLFNQAIPDVWGVFVGLMALLFEGFAIYCWNNQGKSSGKHRTALQIFSVVFTVVSIAHAAASVYELVNAKVALGPSITQYVFWYSHVVAFPLIFGLMVLAMFVLGFTHWSAKIAKARAQSQVKIAESRANLVTETVQLENESQLAQSRLEFERKKLQREMEAADLLAETVMVEKRKLDTLRSVADPELRKRLATAFGLPALDQPVTAEKKESHYLTPPRSQATGSNQSSNFFFPDNESKK